MAIMNTNLYRSLKTITDGYLWMLHKLKGFHIDSIEGFRLYHKKFKSDQISISNKLGVSINDLDKTSMTYSTGAPNDPNALITHECTQGELKARLDKGGLNENLVGQFFLVVAYEYWERIRGDIADIMQIERNAVKSDIFGDIRHIRHDIIHNFGIATKDHSTRTVILKKIKENTPICIGIDELDTIIEEIFKYFNKLSYDHTGQIIYADNSLSLSGKAKQMYYIKNGKITVRTN